MSNYFLNINEASKILQEIHFYEAAYSLSDTGVTHRLITYWDEKGLLHGNNKQGEWRKFNFVELIWIRLVAKLRKLNVGVSTILEIKKELEKTIDAKEFKANSTGQEVIDNIIDSNNLGDDFKNKVKQKIESDQGEFGVSYFHSFLLQVILEKQFLSVIVALQDSANKELTRLGSEIWMTIFNPHKLQKLSETKDYFDIFTKTHLSISLNELIDNTLIYINPEKLPAAFVNLNEREIKIFKLIRSGAYKTINIKFNEKKEPETLELSEIKKLKMESRLLEIVQKGGYQDIEIKTQAGHIFHCKSTKKVKL